MSISTIRFGGVSHSDFDDEVVFAREVQILGRVRVGRLLEEEWLGEFGVFPRSE